MRARDYLGDYYSRKGDYDRSDSLYLSILKCPVKASMRGIDNAVAIGAIAANNNLRGYKEEAMRLYNIALPYALRVKDSTLAGGYALHLGRLYMEEGRLDKTRELIGLAREYLTAGNLPIRNWERFYTLSRDYYLKVNRADTAALYIDSIASIQEETDIIYNARVLAYAEQEAFEAERELKEEQLQKQRARIIMISVVLVLCLVVLAILFYFYRKLQEKNRTLFLQIKAHDTETAKNQELLFKEATKTIPEDLTVDARQRILFVRLREYLLKDKNFAKAEVDTHSLISELSTNRSYLFKAIKVYTGKTLQEYINFLRLEEAKHLLETTDDVIEQIALVCGYNSPALFTAFLKPHTISVRRLIAKWLKIVRFYRIFTICHNKMYDLS